MAMTIANEVSMIEEVPVLQKHVAVVVERERELQQNLPRRKSNGVSLALRNLSTTSNLFREAELCFSPY